jgi:hypothetical protein
MNLFDYLRSHKAEEDPPYAIGSRLGVFAFLIVAIFGLTTVNYALLRSGSLAAVITAVLVDLANEDRNDNSLQGLTINPVLTAAAQAKANDMAEREYFAHVSPDGKNSWYWFREAGYSFLYAGENLAVNFSDSKDVEKAWMNSPTHRANILDGHFTEIGIATAEGSYQGHRTTFVVQMFGTPAAIAAAPMPVREVTTPTQPTEPAIATTLPPPTPEPAAAVTTVATVSPTVAAVPTTTSVLGTEAGSVTKTTLWQRIIASPKNVLRYAYLILAAIILVLLAYTTELELHRRHMRHFSAALILFLVMGGLFAFADFVLFSEPVIAAITFAP